MRDLLDEYALRAIEKLREEKFPSLSAQVPYGAGMGDVKKAEYEQARPGIEAEENLKRYLTQDQTEQQLKDYILGDNTDMQQPTEPVLVDPIIAKKALIEKINPSLTSSKPRGIAELSGEKLQIPDLSQYDVNPNMLMAIETGKMNLGSFADMAKAATNLPSASAMYAGIKMPQNVGAEPFERMIGAYDKAIPYRELMREQAQRRLEQAQMQMRQDPNSQISQAARMGLEQAGIKVAPNMSAAQIAEIYGQPGKFSLETLKNKAELEKAKLMADAVRMPQLMEKQQQWTDKQTELLSKRMQETGLDQLENVIKRISGLIDLDNKKQDIPGVGATAAMPDFLITQKGKDVRSTIAELQNIILQARSGKAVSDKEADRMLKELGIGMARSDEQLRVGIKNAVERLNAAKLNLLAGFREPIKQEFESRGGSIKPINISTKIRVRHPDGRTGSIPKEQLDEALKLGYEVVE